MSSIVRLRLYVAGDGPNSMQAIANLNSLCKQKLVDRHSIEIVDVFQQPHRALRDGVLLTPTLVKVAPAPVRRIVGTLSESEQLIRALGVEP